MNKTLNTKTKIYVNIMELLVDEEIDKQLKFYPKQLKEYINKIEVATYALNRLPPLYASSAMGKEYQKRTGQQKYKSQITLAVRRALAAIERDPLKRSVPLISERYAEYEVAKIALNKLEKLLQNKGIITNSQQLSWNNLNKILYPLITQNQPTKIIKDVEDKSLSYISKQLNQELSDSRNLRKY
ncbi:late competence development ComFB family protein [Cyanothece sp. BG0011]|uniref:late competence development ComFB family protein n=1 Tax=Cyanothece sp. BG0011 TaxID=2082950 RepID=UPI000D1E24CC|nr:late competence development ComFB family protein [Cyanothece sp. BG0011]